MTTTISISKSELLSRLQSVGRIISSRPLLPIMSYVLFDIQDGKVNITAADTLGSINTTIEGIITENETSICFEPKILIDTLKTLPEQPISITIDNDHLNIVVKYKGGKFELPGKPSDEFPKEKEIKDAEIIDIPLNVFLSGINKTSMCVANDELRPVMTGVFIDITEGSLNHIASNGKLYRV